MNHIIIGQNGEEAATKYLQEKGFEILARNYRYKKAEVDIIAQKKQLIIFVEVKTRTGTSFGFPEEAVNCRKIELIQKAAEHYLGNQMLEYVIRFDILSLLRKGKGYEIEHFEDAF